MNRCPITYEHCCDEKYSKRGLRLLSRSLPNLNDFPYSAKEQIQLAAQMSEKISIQGVQPKLSVRLNLKKRQFEVVIEKGTFILKPPHQIYEELPQNEDLTMKLAALAGIEVPLHGMIYNIDGSLTYFIKRFDRLSNGHKVGIEDFSQLSGASRETKYESSMERVVSIIDKHCTFPAIEKLKLFRLVIFNFLTGNEDMHLKNFTLIKQKNLVELSPAYDLLNTTIVLQSKEEIALPIRGKKSRLNHSDVIDYFGGERLQLPKAVIDKELQHFENCLTNWQKFIKMSFLSEKLLDSYQTLIQNRWQRLK